MKGKRRNLNNPDFAQKHAISDPSEVGALALGLALSLIPFARTMPARPARRFSLQNQDCLDFILACKK